MTSDRTKVRHIKQYLHPLPHPPSAIFLPYCSKCPNLFAKHCRSVVNEPLVVLSCTNLIFSSLRYKNAQCVLLYSAYGMFSLYFTADEVGNVVLAQTNWTADGLRILYQVIPLVVTMPKCTIIIKRLASTYSVS